MKFVAGLKKLQDNGSISWYCQAAPSASLRARRCSIHRACRPVVDTINYRRGLKARLRVSRDPEIKRVRDKPWSDECRLN